MVQLHNLEQFGYKIFNHRITDFYFRFQRSVSWGVLGRQAMGDMSNEKLFPSVFFTDCWKLASCPKFTVFLLTVVLFFCHLVAMLTAGNWCQNSSSMSVSRLPFIASGLCNIGWCLYSVTLCTLRLKNKLCDVHYILVIFDKPMQL